jgi:GT2 family glycosyltransferase
MIAVVMVSFHTGPVLWRSLDAALAQEGVGEVVLVDNGNDEETLLRLEDTAAREPKLRILTGHGNIGFAAGCNLGAAASEAGHLLFLNPDAHLPEGGAAALLSAGSGREEPWAVGPRLVGPDGDEQRGSRRAILTPWNAFVEASRLYRVMPNHPYFARFNDHEAEPAEGVTEVPCLSGACFLLPRTSFDRVGGFDDAFFLHVEDVDFFLRMSRAGGTMLFEPAVRVKHYKSSSRVDPLRIERLKRQSLNLYFASHFKGYYPPGFLTLLRGMLWTAFGARAARYHLRRTRDAVWLVRRGGFGALARARRLGQARKARKIQRP